MEAPCPKANYSDDQNKDNADGEKPPVHALLTLTICLALLKFSQSLAVVAAFEGLCHQFRHLSAGLAEFPASLRQFRHQCLLLCQVAVSVRRLLHLRHIQPRTQWRQLKD